MTEVLVAMIVLGISVLAFAGMQTRALQSTGTSYQRSQAMQLASELVERMRANNTAMTTYRNASLYGPANIPSGVPSSWAGSCTQSSVANDGCTTVQMATYDIHEVGYMAAQLLPNGQVSVSSCPATVGLDCVFVAWGSTAMPACTDNTILNCIALRVVIQ